MSFEFKHLVFIGAMFCAGWALVVSGLIAVEQLGSVELPSELAAEDGGENFSKVPLFDKYAAMAQTLNVVLPLGLICIAFLIYTYQLNPIGMGSLLVIIGIFAAATVSSMGACDRVESVAKIDLKAHVWWMR